MVVDPIASNDLFSFCRTNSKPIMIELSLRKEIIYIVISFYVFTCRSIITKVKQKFYHVTLGNQIASNINNFHRVAEFTFPTFHLMVSSFNGITF